MIWSLHASMNSSKYDMFFHHRKISLINLESLFKYFLPIKRFLNIIYVTPNRRYFYLKGHFGHKQT